MSLRDVNWRFALYSAALLGGALWSGIASAVIHSRRGVDTGGFTISMSQWLVIAGISVAVLLVGAAVNWFARSIMLRSTGIGLMICATSGWVMIAWIAIQFLVDG